MPHPISRLTNSGQSDPLRSLPLPGLVLSPPLAPGNAPAIIHPSKDVKREIKRLLENVDIAYLYVILENMYIKLESTVVPLPGLRPPFSVHYIVL